MPAKTSRHTFSPGCAGLRSKWMQSRKELSVGDLFSTQRRKPGDLRPCPALPGGTDCERKEQIRRAGGGGEEARIPGESPQGGRSRYDEPRVGGIGGTGSRRIEAAHQVDKGTAARPAVV